MRRVEVHSLWTDPDGASLQVENNCFEAHQGEWVVVSAVEGGDAVAVGLTPEQAREMASTLIVYAFFADRPDRTNAARAEADDD